MGRKTARPVGAWFMLLGVIGAITSIAWWQSFYSQVIGHAPIECLYQLTGSCRIVSNVSEFFSAAARLLWGSGIVGIFGLLLQR